MTKKNVAGLEPATSGLTCRRFTNWAKLALGGLPILSISLFRGVKPLTLADVGLDAESILDAYWRLYHPICSVDTNSLDFVNSKHLNLRHLEFFYITATKIVIFNFVTYIHYSKKFKEHFDIMIFIERYPLKRCQGCVKLIASKVNCFLNINDFSEVQLCMSSNSWTWECPHIPKMVLIMFLKFFWVVYMCMGPKILMVAYAQQFADFNDIGHFRLI